MSDTLDQIRAIEAMWDEATAALFAAFNDPDYGRSEDLVIAKLGHTIEPMLLTEFRKCMPRHQRPSYRSTSTSPGCSRPC